MSNVRLATCVLALVSGFAAVAQDALTLNRPVAREIAPGTTQSYSIRLNAGDYASGSITQQGRTNIVMYHPNGSLLRRFPAPAPDAKRTFAFVAEAAGAYRIEMAAPAGQSSKYELVLSEVTPLSERLKPEPWSDPIPSPRIEALRKQIAAGQATTDAFWKQVAQEGTPLTEPFGTDGKYQLVTFLWRGTPETQNVLVAGSFLRVRNALDVVMHRIASTDVWYLTLKLPSGARFSYQLSPNDPLTFDGPRAAQHSATAQADPLNPRNVGCLPNSSKYACSSEADLPGAVPQPWIVKKPGTPEGKIENHQIKSDIQKLDRPISVYTPPGYRADGPPNALLVLFDGPTYLDDQTRAPTTLDNLIAASKIPATVAVLVSNVGNRRLQDLVPNPEFADFMANELIPWVRARYNVTQEPRQTVVGGFSAGGLAAAYMGLRHPEVFGNVLSQSGSFWWAPDHYEDPDSTTETNWTAKQFMASPKLPLKFYMDAGTFEADRDGSGGAILETSRHLRDLLLAKGYDVHYQQFVGGHDGLSWRGTLADGLMALIGVK